MRTWIMIEYGITIALVPLWWLVYSRARHVLDHNTSESFHTHLRSLRFRLWPAVCLTTVKLAATIRMWMTDWSFVEDKVLIQWPLYLCGMFAIFMFSLPELYRREQLAFSSMKGRAGGLPNPIIFLPFSAAFTASAASAIQMLFFAQSPLRFETLYGVWAGFGLGVALQAFTYRRHLNRQAAGGKFARQENSGKRFLRMVQKGLVLLVVVSTIVASGLLSSRLPDRMSMMDHGSQSSHGGHANASHNLAGLDHADSPVSAAVMSPEAVSVEDLRGPQDAPPDRSFTISASKLITTLPTGEHTELWTFNQTVPGPELRVKEGDLVEVVLHNVDIEDGVTIHWHGLNVPNGEDGVAGLTQDAVMPGERFVYRFITNQTGTYWYHSHQQSSVQVAKGLYGTLIIEPKEGIAEDVDMTVMSHSHGTSNGSTITLGPTGVLSRRIIEPGTAVRIRLINAHNMPRIFYVSGARYRVAAIDGVNLNGPEWMEDRPLLLAAGGRYDLALVMPEHAVSVSHSLGTINETSEAVVLSATDHDMPAPGVEGTIFDPAHYGAPAPVPFDSDTKYDKAFTLVLDNRVGFYNGTMTNLQTINGYVFPDTPSLMVSEGDVVKMKFVNRGFMDHPMHLHGHHLLVLSRNGIPVQGSPWWTDSLNVAPGEVYEAAFVADNPGLWMDHCHNLEHAAAGMSMHLMYEGVYTPFEIGRSTVNIPE